MDDRYFGSEATAAMMRRSAMLQRIVADNPRLAWYGRAVAVAGYAPGDFPLLEALARLQGVGLAYWVPIDASDALQQALEEAGFKSDRFECVANTTPCVDRARALLEQTSLPPDIEVLRIGKDSPDDDVADFAELALSEGVLPPPEAVIRGFRRAGAFLLARERSSGRAVSCATCIETYHPQSEYGDCAFWGMLSTVPDRRGERIALVLGARAMVTMADEAGFKRFQTGVRADNAASMALCAKLGLHPGTHTLIVAMDPAQFGDERVTK